MCALLYTKKDINDDYWSPDGQCVVVHSDYVLTAAHVLFYPEEEQLETGRKRRFYHQMAKFKATFFDPIEDKSYDVDLEPVRYSGTTDAALLRISRSNFSPVSVPYIAENIFHSDDVILVVYSKDKPWQLHELSGRVASITKEQKTENKHSCLLAKATYHTQNGYSGGAVFHYNHKKYRWELYGFHVCADSLDYINNETKNTHQGTKKKRKLNPMNPVDPINDVEEQQEPLRRLSLSSNNSYNSHSSGSELGEEHQKVDFNAIVHAQANSTLATFVVAHSVFENKNWNPAQLTHDDLPAHSGPSSDSSPPHPISSQSHSLRNDPSLLPGIIPLDLYDPDE
jgi:hypothetical protein